MLVLETKRRIFLLPFDQTNQQLLGYKILNDICQYFIDKDWFLYFE